MNLARKAFDALTAAKYSLTPWLVDTEGPAKFQVNRPAPTAKFVGLFTEAELPALCKSEKVKF